MAVMAPKAVGMTAREYTATCCACGDVDQLLGSEDDPWAAFRAGGWAHPETLADARCPRCAAADPPPDLSEANLRRLADIHLRRYAHLLQRGHRGDPSVRVHECRDLLAAWRAVCAANFVFAACPPEAQREITDAIEAGE